MCVNQERPRLGALPAALAAVCLLLLFILPETSHAQPTPSSFESSSKPMEIPPDELDPLQNLLQALLPGPTPSPLVDHPIAGAGDVNLRPQLKRANLVPGMVDVSAGNRNVMAIAEVGLSPEVRGVTFYLRPRDSSNPPTLTIAGTLISTTPTFGRWEAPLSIPKGCLPGRWSLAVVVQSARGGSVDFGPFGETPLPSNSARELLIINSGDVDFKVPQVEILKVDPQLAFVGCGNLPTPVKIRLRVRASSGLEDTDSSFVQLTRSDRTISTSTSTLIGGEVLNEGNRIAGNALDGIYEATVRVPPGAEAGEFVAGAVAQSRVGWTGKMVRPGPKVHVRSLKNLPRGYIEWATKNFPGSFPDPDCQFHALWRPDADLDGDGVINCVEAYFGTSPTNKADAPKILVSFDSKRQFVVNWTQPQSTYGMTVQPEWSSDLDLWSASGEGFAGRKARTIHVLDAGPAPKGGLVKEARFDVTGLPYAYLRLRVLMP